MITQLALTCIVIYLAALNMEYIIFKGVELPNHWQLVGGWIQIISFTGSTLFTLCTIWIYL